MRTRRALALLAIFALAALPAAPGPAASHPGPGDPAAGHLGLGDPEPASEVDPLIGTLGAGFVFPGPAAPYGMVQLSPDTEGFFSYTGYMWFDQFIRGFSHVHVQGMGVPSAGNLPFLPTSGPVDSTDVEDYQSTYLKASEKAEPGYYRVFLSRYGVDAELTAGTRVGLHRYTFPPGRDGNVLIDVGRQIPGGPATPPFRTPGQYRALADVIDNRTVVGTANPGGADGPQNYPVHFAARFSRPFDGYGTWERRGDPVAWGTGTVDGRGAGVAVRFEASGEREVLVKVGISFVSQQNALANLEDELPGQDFDFEGLRARTWDAWNDALSVIRISGGTPSERRVFYTALYHVQNHPNVFSDANGDYLGHDGAVHRIGAPDDPMPAGSTYYANYSFWDTYRGQVQLLALIAPDRFRDMMRSLGAIATQGGRLPRWSLQNRYPDFMPGEPALQVVSDAYCRGLLPADALDAVWESARDLALVNRRDSRYLTHGYVPRDDSSRSASATLEHGIGDLALAQMADGLGHTADRDALLALATGYRHLLDPDTRWIRPRRADGSWVEPFYPMGDPTNPGNNDGFQEGTSWQWSWLVPHDVRGLFDRMGAPPEDGDRFVEERLDTFFGYPLTSTVPFVWPEVQQKLTLYGIMYMGNQYPPSNEQSLHAPYLYPWIGKPWKTQALVRAYQGLYRDAPDGIPGNDDLGTLSAWFVWSALGFYPAIAGTPVYIIGSPLFEGAAIDLEDGGTFTVRAPGASLVNKYVYRAKLNGEWRDRAWFTHDAITDGGSLLLPMGPIEETTWATDPGAAPPSLSTHTLADFGCRP